MAWTRAKETDDQCGLISQSMEATIEKMDYIGNQSWQSNLHFEGIAESPWVRRLVPHWKKGGWLYHGEAETPWIHHRESTLNEQVIFWTFNQNNSIKCRTIVVCFSQGERINPHHCQELHDPSIIMHQDYLQWVQEMRQQLLPEMGKLRWRGIMAHIKYDVKQNAMLIQPQKLSHPFRRDPPTPGLGTAPSIHRPKLSKIFSTGWIWPRCSMEGESTGCHPYSMAQTLGSPSDLAKTHALSPWDGAHLTFGNHPTSPTTSEPPNPVLLLLPLSWDSTKDSVNDTIWGPCNQCCWTISSIWQIMWVPSLICYCLV